MPVNLKGLCFSAQVNTAIISTRIAIRSLSARNLIVCPGLTRKWLPAAEARELRALMLAEQHLRRATI